MRACDGFSRPQDVVAVAALIHCLVLDLEHQLDEGVLPPPLPPWHVQENKWRAARYGLDAIIIRDAENTEVHVVDDVNELLERLAPTARTLGCTRELAGITDILDAGAGYQRMRAAAQAGGGRRPHGRGPRDGRAPGPLTPRVPPAQVSSSSRRSSAVRADDIAAPSSTTRANRSRLRSCRATTFSSMVSRETIR